jgi:hypothetical protein
MALDRLVHFTTRRPTRALLRRVLVDFFGGAALSIRWSRDRFFVKLPGAHSEAFRRLPWFPRWAKRTTKDPRFDPIDRWIEIWLDIKSGKTVSVDVMTRRADDFTNGIAARLADCIARFWSGKLEAG